MRSITIGQNDAGQRLDKFLLKCLPALPKSMLYKAIRKKRIKYNGARCKGMEILAIGDTLDLYLNDEFFEKKADTGFEKATGSLSVAYEDDHILIVNKPVGQFAHSGNEKGAVSLIDDVKKYLHDKGEFRPEQEQSFSPALCNRIDRNTEGLVIAAKTAAALRTMNEAIRDRHVHKQYLAITAAPLPKRQDTCTAFLKKESSQNIVRVVDRAPDRSWQMIRTRYRVLAQEGERQLVCIDLLTGRTHQIRAHFAHLGAPLLGDPKYGGQKDRHSEENQCLCAFSLRFTHLADTVLSELEGKQILAPLPSFVRTHFPTMTDPQIRRQMDP